MSFKKFTSKFDSRCQCCTKKIAKGDSCYIRKLETGKWDVVCNDCYAAGRHHELKGGSASGSSFAAPSDDLSEAIAAARAEEINRGLGDIGADIAKSEPMTFEEKIKLEAKWAIK